MSGAPYDPTCSVTAGQPSPASYTGTPIFLRAAT